MLLLDTPLLVLGRDPINPKTRTFALKPDKPEPEYTVKFDTRRNPNPKIKPAGTRKPLKWLKIAKNLGSNNILILTP